MRLIDADKLKEQLFQISVVADDWYGMGINRGLDRAETAIDLMPTVDIKTEVAREIFAELLKEANLRFDGFRNTIIFPLDYYNDLKNKYIKDGVGE